MKRTLFALFSLTLSTSAWAGMPVDTAFMTEVRLPKPSCDGDYECSKAIEALNSRARSSARSDARSQCKDLASMLGYARGEYKSLSIRDLIPRVEGSEIVYHVSGTVYCTVYTD